MHFVISMLVSKVQFAYHCVGVIGCSKVHNIHVFDTAVVVTATHSCLGLWADIFTALGGFSW